MLAALLGTACCAESLRPKTKAAATPEDAVKYLLEAALADDLDAFHAQLGAHTRALMETGRAIEAYDNALNTRYGKRTGRGDRPSVKSELLRFKRGAWQIRGKVAKDKDRVALTVWEITRREGASASIREETWTSIKEPTGWKIVLPPKGVIEQAMRKDSDGKEIKVTVLKTGEFDPAQSAREKKMWLDAKKVLEKLTKEVRAGKYETREKAEAALDDAKDQLYNETK
jgi:hypothetical protein